MPSLTLRGLTPDEVSAVYQNEMTRDFPPAELKPLSAIRRMQAVNMYETLGAFRNEALVGYAFLTVLEDCPTALLDYLAVLPAERGKGVGSEILALLKARFAGRLESILIESEYPPEAPAPAIAERRLGFYTRAGGRCTTVKNRVFGVRYVIFSLDCGAQALPGETLEQHLKTLYHRMVPEKWFAQNVFFGADAERQAQPKPWR